MPDTTTPHDPRRPPGATVASRIEHWRSLSWSELAAMMQPPAGEHLALADAVSAPPVLVVAVADGTE